MTMHKCNLHRPDGEYGGKGIFRRMRMEIANIVDRKGKHVETVTQSTPLGAVVQTMQRKKIGCVLINSEQDDTVVGIVSQQEVVDAISLRGASALAAPALMFARKPVLFCSCSDKVETVLQRMTLERSRHAVVCKTGEIVAGLVSLGDLVAGLLEDAQLETGVLRDMARSHLMSPE